MNLSKAFKKNCCDGIYNSFDVHFTSACDNKCEHCIDTKYQGGVPTPNISEIVNTIMQNQEGYDDVLFLGGEPCLYLDELVECVKQVKIETALKVFVTTAVPKVCHDKEDLFYELIDLVDGINLSTQHHDEAVADTIRRVPSVYDRQSFYKGLPMKNKVRININIVKPFLYTKEDIMNCVKHYSGMGFKDIKISEIQHGKDHFVSFEDLFGLDLGSPYSKGCQQYLDAAKLMPGVDTSLLLKRSCFLCEETLKASLLDGIKVAYQLFNEPRNKYAVIYGDGSLSNGWR